MDVVVYLGKEPLAVESEQVAVLTYLPVDGAVLVARVAE